MPQSANGAIPDAPIDYIARTHAYYRALGYEAPFRYAHFADAPLTPLAKPLAECRIAIVTTAAPHREGLGDQGPGAPYNAAAKFYAVYSGDSAGEPDLRIAHVAYDRVHTRADDMNTWFPLAALKRAAAEGRIGAVAPRFHGAPTNRSQRTTANVDAPEILKRCREDAVDAVVLAPNCPICHQVCAIVARALEAGGLPTVVMGCAKDIVELAAAPRFLFSDFPLGNSCGRPHDVASQSLTLALALTLLAEAKSAPTTVTSPLKWSADPSWKRDYASVDALTPEDIAQRRTSFDAGKHAARELREKPPLPPASAGAAEGDG